MQRGAPPICHVVAERTEIDDRRPPLAETLEYVHGYPPAILICVQGRLAYYKPKTWDGGSSCSRDRAP